MVGEETDSEAPPPSLLAKRGSSSQSAGDQGRTKVPAKRTKKGSCDLGNIVLPVTKKRPTSEKVGPMALVLATSPTARSTPSSAATLPIVEEIRGSTGDAPALSDVVQPTSVGESSTDATVVGATPAAEAVPAEPGTSGEGLVVDPIFLQGFKRIAIDESDYGDKDAFLSLSKFVSPDFPPLREIRPNDPVMTLDEHISMIDMDRNRQYALVATTNAQGLLIGKLKQKLRLQAKEHDSATKSHEAKLAGVEAKLSDEEAKRAGVEAKLAGVETALAKSDEKVITSDCQLETTTKEKEQANVELLQALGLVSKRDLEIAEVRASYNELLPSKLSCESRIPELEDKLRQEQELCQTRVTASCKAYAIQFTEENGLPPPEFEDEESDEFGLDFDPDEANPKGKNVVAVEDSDDASDPDAGPAV